MKTIHVYDPPMCCSTGLCGAEVNPVLVTFAAMLTELTAKGVSVQRYNMGQQPLAFVQNPTVIAVLEKEGLKALPLILLDGEVYQKGRYPTDDERAALTTAALSESTGVTS